MITMAYITIVIIIEYVVYVVYFKLLLKKYMA